MNGRYKIQFGEFASELGGELVIREDAGVLEAAQDVVWDAGQVAIGDGGFQGTTSAVGDGMFGIREPAQEVLRAIVERILDKMVADAVVGLALTIDKGRALAVEDFAHEDVAGFAIMMAHCRPPIASTDGFCTHSGRVNVCQSMPRGINEIGASLACP